MTTRRGYKEIFQEFFDEFIELGMDENEAGIEAYKKMQDALDPGNYNDPFKAEGGRVGLQEGGEPLPIGSTNPEFQAALERLRELKVIYQKILYPFNKSHRASKRCSRFMDQNLQTY